MLEVTQTKLHIPNQQKGNCTQAVLASLLHVDIESVPLFEGRDWIKQMNTYLKQFGLAFLFVPTSNAEDFAYDGVTDLHHALAGNTNRFAGIRHMVVARDGELLFDVHPSRTGLTDGLVSGVFVSLEPWKVAETYTQNKEKQHE